MHEFANATDNCKKQCKFATAGVAPTYWGKPDKEIGIPEGVTTEDFTDATLTSGLSMVWSGEDGSFDDQPALTKIDDLLTPSKDPGNAFKDKAFWGDAKAVTNFARGKTINYGDAKGWRRLRLQFAAGVSFVGFSLQQTDTHDELFVVNKGLASEKTVHRKDIPNVQQGNSLGRDGYFMFKMDEDCCDSIKTIDIGVGNGDGFAVDHIAFLTKGCSSGACALTTTGVAPSYWGKPDKEIGIPEGVTTEDFTDATLTSGLSMVWSGEDGSFDDQPALTKIDDLLTPSKDPGNAFKDKAFWGDAKAVTNFARGKTINYGDAKGWRRLRLQFAAGVSFVGFSLQQTDTHDELFVVNKGLASEKTVHRKDIPNVQQGNSLGRDGYFMFKMDEDCCDSIKTIDIGVGNGDGFAVDHITYIL